MRLIFSLLLVFVTGAHCFRFNSELLSQRRSEHFRFNQLFMGRAAAVRANTKARTDGAKAKNNNIFAKKIITTVKAGGPDPESNRQLAAVIADAKAANVPNDVIKRNIDKASTTVTADYKESLFEFIGPGSTYLLVNVVTDNDNRATSEVNLVGKKNGLKPGSKGSVSFNFIKKARLDITGSINEDELMTLCLDNGIDDYELKTDVDGNPLNPKEEGKCVVYVDMKDMSAMRDVLRANKYVLETSIAQVPKDGAIDPSQEDFDANLTAIDAFLALDDVDSVEHNIDMSIN